MLVHNIIFYYLMYLPTKVFVFRKTTQLYLSIGFY